jgi:hypothetical protein
MELTPAIIQWAIKKYVYNYSNNCWIIKSLYLLMEGTKDNIQHIQNIPSRLKGLCLTNEEVINEWKEHIGFPLHDDECIFHLELD